MATKTTIEWTDTTWNPVTGCTKVSPGCAHCYAETITLRFKRGGPFLPGKTTIKLHSDRLNQPSSWREHRMVFVNSMGDLFHEEVPFDFVSQVFEEIESCPRPAAACTVRDSRWTFAKDVNRDDIQKGADELGIDLDEHSMFIVGSIKLISEQIDLAPSVGG